MFKKVKELQEAGKISKEVAKELDSEISTALKTLRDENAVYRNKNKELVESLNEVNTSKAELEKQVGDLDERIKKAKEDGKNELATQLEAEKADKQALSEKLEAVSAKNRELTRTNAIQAGLKDFELIDSDVVSAAVEKFIVLEDDGSVKFKDGENSLSVSDGLKAYFENKPHLLKSSGNGGSGAGAGGAGGAKMTKSEYLSLSLEKQAELTAQNPNIIDELGD